RYLSRCAFVPYTTLFRSDRRGDAEGHGREPRLMINHYPAWKNTLVIIVVVFGILYAMPNFFGFDPAVQVSRENATAIDRATVGVDRKSTRLNSSHVKISY